jgi:hypothetical protein
VKIKKYGKLYYFISYLIKIPVGLEFFIFMGVLINTIKYYTIGKELELEVVE